MFFRLVLYLEENVVPYDNANIIGSCFYCKMFLISFSVKLSFVKEKLVKGIIGFKKFISSDLC